MRNKKSTQGGVEKHRDCPPARGGTVHYFPSYLRSQMTYGNAKLTEGMARQAIEMIKAGKTNVAIGRELGITHSLISRIRVGRSWTALSEQMGYEPKASKLAPKSGRTKAGCLPNQGERDE